MTIRPHGPRKGGPVLRVVASAEDAAVPAKEPKRWQGTDPVFFHRSQVRIGTVLRCFGRIDHGALWRVVEIKTYLTGRRGGTYTRRLGEARRLDDEVVLNRVGSNENRSMRFANLSYSAIWRIE